ncbi:uncharacterized protein LOC124207149 [Daphnia pulex]|uniref:uncharacterized protein LOC124207149 n=1 Tax=Daphnia pulex TaxID=6669 RepID=UPI001EDFB084|nr:uncharacterized protein LOC124207149 [Daphnia pulex]
MYVATRNERKPQNNKSNYENVIVSCDVSVVSSYFSSNALDSMFLADSRPEPVIVTTQQPPIMQVLLVQVLTCRQQQSQDHRLPDKKHPIGLEELRCHGSLLFPFLSMFSCMPMRVWVYSRGHPFYPYPVLVPLNSSS